MISKDPNFDFNSFNPAASWVPFKLFNIENSSPLKLMTFIQEIENDFNFFYIN